MEIEFEFGGIEIEIKGWQGLATLAGIGLLASAIIRELSLPPSKRRWHGRIGGLIPYDLRPPTLDRIQHTVWNPSSRRVVVPTAFGVGWSLNLPALVSDVTASPGRLVEQLRSSGW